MMFFPLFVMGLLYGFWIIGFIHAFTQYLVKMGNLITSHSQTKKATARGAILVVTPGILNLAPRVRHPERSEGSQID